MISFEELGDISSLEINQIIDKVTYKIDYILYMIDMNKKTFL